MADIRKYISVLKPPASTGSVVLNFKSQNPSGDYIDLDFTVNLSSGDDEITTAGKIMDQILAALVTAEKNYSGPSFSEPISQTWRLYQCDHIVNVWSEAPWAIKQKSNASGAFLAIDTIPVYSTFADIDNFAELLGVEFVEDDGTPYSDTKKANALRLAAQMIVSAMDNDPVVASIYLHSEFGHLQRSIKPVMEPLIGVFPDKITERLPFRSGLLGYNATLFSDDFDIDYENNRINFYIPLDFETIFKFSYAAGQSSVPPVLKQLNISTVRYLSVPTGFRRIQGQDFSATFDPQQVRDTITQAIGL